MAIKKEMPPAIAPTTKARRQLSSLTLSGLKYARIAKPSTMTTAATKRQKTITSMALLRLLSAIRSRKVAWVGGIAGFRWLWTHRTDRTQRTHATRRRHAFLLFVPGVLFVPCGELP